MIKQLFDDVVLRPGNALLSSLEMMTQNISNVLKINAVISRSIHSLSRPVLNNESATHPRAADEHVAPPVSDGRDQTRKDADHVTPRW